MKTFSVSGTFRMGLRKKQPFSKEVKAKDQESAKELIYTTIGSQHGCPRRFILIEKIEEFK